MASITIPGSLNQHKLSEALREIAGDQWCGNEVQLPGSKRNWDIAIYTPEGIALIEYDGDAHYCDPFRMKIDQEKDRLAEVHGYRVIHFPYWLQLDSTTLTYFFDLSATIRQDFPHGFITTRIFPVDFCERGVKRFLRELRDLPLHIAHEVMQSLRDRAKEYGEKNVLPSHLTYLLEGDAW